MHLLFFFSGHDLCRNKYKCKEKSIQAGLTPNEALLLGVANPNYVRVPGHHFLFFLESFLRTIECRHPFCFIISFSAFLFPTDAGCAESSSSKENKLGGHPSSSGGPSAVATPKASATPSLIYLPLGLYESL